jgi:hypothetical protein
VTPSFAETKKAYLVDGRAAAIVVKGRRLASSDNSAPAIAAARDLPRYGRDLRR